MNLTNFNTLNNADGFIIQDVPWVGYCQENKQVVYCKEENKKLVVNNNTIETADAGPEMVDLGLPSGTLWAATNIGAEPGSTKESYYGNFYAWGGTQTQESYDGNNCPYCTLWDDDEGEYQFTKYVPTNQTGYWGGEGDPDNKLVLDLTDDVANVTYGSNYRMPTQAELEELKALPNKWVTDFKGISGLNGRIFAKTQVELDGTFNDDTMLFIPAAGYFNGSTHYFTGSYCLLWSSSLHSDDPYDAWSLSFYSDGIDVGNSDRYLGFSVRAVRKSSQQ